MNTTLHQPARLFSAACLVRGWLVVMLLLGGLLGCSQTAVPPPRTRDQIFTERLNLPALYLTAKTHKRVVAPGSKGLFVDEATGEVCWRALACRAPNCPGRGASGEPYLFTENDLSYFAKPDNSVGFDPKRAKQQPKQVGLCPKCNEILDPAAATPTQGVQHSQWVQAYVLPESLARSQSLDAEFRRRVTFDRQHQMQRTPDKGPSE